MTVKIKQGMLLKSFDEEYVYNIYSYSPLHPIMVVDVLNKNLETIATKTWDVKDFLEQISVGTIIPFQEKEIIGK